MRPIPSSLRDEMAKDPYYKKCCMGGHGKIDWHHNFIHGGRQINEKWCILPLSRSIHEIANRKDIKEELDRIMLRRATKEDLARYPKVNWEQKKKWLGLM